MRDPITSGFVDNAANLPSCGQEIDQKIEAYMHGIAQWIRGSDFLTVDTTQYFGMEGPDIHETRLIPIREKFPRNDSHPNRRFVVALPIISYKIQKPSQSNNK